MHPESCAACAAAAAAVAAEPIASVTKFQSHLTISAVNAGSLCGQREKQALKLKHPVQHPQDRTRLDLIAPEDLPVLIRCSHCYDAAFRFGKHGVTELELDTVFCCRGLPHEAFPEPTLSIRCSCCRCADRGRQNHFKTRVNLCCWWTSSRSREDSM